jgi:excisionase family DNA binding protein
MTLPSLDELLEAPERARALPPDAIAAVIGETLLLLCRLVQASTMPNTTQAKKPEDPDRLLTVRETAALLSVRPPHVYELIRRGRLPAVRVGKYVRVKSGDLKAWLEDQREEGVDGRIQPGLSSLPPMSRSSMKARGQKSH